MAKIELVKKTTAVYGEVYFFIKCNGSMLSETWTTDPDKAEDYLKQITEKTRKFPEDTYEILKTVEI